MLHIPDTRKVTAVRNYEDLLRDLIAKVSDEDAGRIRAAFEKVSCVFYPSILFLVFFYA